MTNEIDLKNRLEYYLSMRGPARMFLWFAGSPVSNLKRPWIFFTLKCYCLCVLLFQIFMAMTHIWSDVYMLCCHYISDSAILLRIMHPHVVQMNALIYQIFFFLNASKIRSLLRELNKVTDYKFGSKLYGKAIFNSIFIAFFGLLLVYFCWISTCAITYYYNITYNLRQDPCNYIYYIFIMPSFDELIKWRETYGKFYMQIISLSLSTVGLLFTEYLMSNILHTLATAFDDSHNVLIPILKSESKKAVRKSRFPSKSYRHLHGAVHERDFASWRDRHHRLRLAAKRADSVLSPFALVHSIATPLLLCIAGLQLLLKNQEAFMLHFAVKSVSYYLILQCMFRVWLICDGGEQLAKQVIKSVLKKENK